MTTAKILNQKYLNSYHHLTGTLPFDRNSKTKPWTALTRPESYTNTQYFFVLAAHHEEVGNNTLSLLLLSKFNK